MVRQHKGWLFLVLWLFIGLVSLYDGYLVEQYRESILYMEQNPVGSYLLEMTEGEPSLFLRVKATGTIFVLSTLAVMYVRWQRWAFPVVHAVAMFQFGLLLYMSFSLPVEAYADDETSASLATGEVAPAERSGRYGSERSYFPRARHGHGSWRHRMHDDVNQRQTPSASLHEAG